jgi:hypothetical protein
MLLDLFLIGLVISIEPLPLTGMILLLAAERGIIKGLGFLIGWLATLLGIVALTVLVTGGKPLIPQSSPSTAELIVKAILGGVLVIVGYRRYRRGPKERDPDAPKKQPRWMASIDRINPIAAAGLAFLLQPWVLVAAGISTITEAKLSTNVQYLAVFGFCLWCTWTYFAMEIYAVLRPALVQAKLSALLEWINNHKDQTIVFAVLFLGLYLMSKSIYQLVS